MARNSFYDGNAGDDVIINTSVAQAQLAETNAANSATAAATSEANASTSETNAANSATSAAASLASTASNATAAAASAAAALVSEGLADADATATAADRVQTGLDVTATAADKVATNADVVTTNADVVLTNADVVLTNADVVSTNADAAQTALDRIAVAADLVATNQDTIDTAADLVATNQDAIDTAADVVLTNADVVTTGANVTTSTTQAGIATTQAGIATTQAGIATTKASEASSSATSASTAQAASEAARDASLAALDSFDDRYLGVKASDPTLDNDGNALVSGALYFNDTTDNMKVYEGSSWLNAYSSLTGALLVANNLSDLANAATARTNLGVDPAGTVNYVHPATHTISEVTGLQTALDGKVDDAQVLTNVPSGAVFTDTVYTHPATHTISEVSGLQTALDGKVDDTQVLTNVPSGAVFTDTVYTHPATHTISEVSGLQTALDGKVDDSQVLTNVPSGAVFTDTTYTVGDGGLSEINFTSADNTKLDGIETGATADQTNAEIKIAYEANTNTNEFSDAEQTKLADIEALADVTDTTNVTAAGALMNTGGTSTGAITAPDFIGNLNGAVRFTAKNAEGVAITKGQVVYISGISGEVPTVGLADANDSAKMPGFGLVAEDANNNASVEIVSFGSLTGTKTDYTGWALGDTLYVSTTAGTLTNSAPTGESSLIQNIGKIQRVHASAGIIKVGGAGRTNATPNLNDGNVFIGNASNQSEARALQIADTTGLQTALDGKSDTTHNHDADYAPLSHTHTEYDPAGTGVAMAIALG